MYSNGHTGGGIKGLVPAILLQKFENYVCAPYKVHQLFDLVCGTSTGGIIALGTCIAKKPVGELRSMYENEADSFFGHPRLGRLLGRAKYEAATLEAILQEQSTEFDDRTPIELRGLPGRSRQIRLSECSADSRPKVFVVAAQVNQAAAAGTKLFKAPWEQVPFDTNTQHSSTYVLYGKYCRVLYAVP